ncbi:hypothetical protein E6O75_ATG06701 [Venturia nashicola]|uniref:Uncharacterized protein n=1 Tax=Venturia nashicola TaxID=86259 RepID=A0A4Z1P4T6_9PEZI|nr:hypothetical protein E6O75_ATG06701 [Venturia nashicola]
MSKQSAALESDTEDAAPVEVLQPIDTSRKQGETVFREIADSDAEDDAMDIDDEKPMMASTVTFAIQEPTEQSGETLGSNATFEFEEYRPSSFVEPAPVSSSARQASLELEMEIDNNIADKSLEQSGSNTNPLHEEANLPSAIRVGTTESLSMAYDGPRTNTAGNKASFERRNGTEPESSLSEADRPKHLREDTENSKLDDRLEPQTVEVEPSQKATKPEFHEPQIGLNKRSQQTLPADATIISDVPNNDPRRVESPDLRSAEASTFDSLTSAANPSSDALTEVRSGAHKASQNMNEVEAISASSFSERSLDAPTSDAKEQLEVRNLAKPQAKQTPEQKRMSSLQTRNITLTQTLTSLSQQRTALLYSLSTRLSPYTLADIPSVLKPYRSTKIYTPSTAAHTTPLPAPIAPDDDAKLMAEAREVIKDHIGRLHRYNEIRDVGQGLIGMIADQRGKRIVDCMDEFGVEVGD